MDEYDAPRKMPVEHQENCLNCPNLKELEEQTCLLFEEFLNLNDDILAAPLPASYTAKQEQSDSPVFLNSSSTRSRGLSSRLEQKESLESDDDDVVSDSAPASPPPVAVASAAQVAPSDKMKALAAELAKAGDDLVKEYGGDVEDVEGKLLQLVKQEASNLTYERFALAVDDLVGRDKDWTNLVFAFCVGKRICKHSQEAVSYTKSFFQRYIFQSYSQTLQDSGGWEPFLRSHGAHGTPQ